MGIVVEKKCIKKVLNSKHPWMCWLEDRYIKFDCKPQALQWNLIQPFFSIARESFFARKNFITKEYFVFFNFYNKEDEDFHQNIQCPNNIEKYIHKVSNSKHLCLIFLNKRWIKKYRFVCKKQIFGCLLK
jgi:hypothetical protein